MTTNPKFDFTVYTVTEYGHGKDKKTRWTAIGVAWMNQDGQGLNIDMDALPLNGKLVLRAPKAKEENAE